MFDSEFKTIEVINENFIVVEWNRIQMIYSVEHDKYQMNSILSNVSGKSESNKWLRTQEGQLFKQKFPHYFQNLPRLSNRLRGWYVDLDLVPIIVCWANPLRGFYLINNMNEYVSVDTTGFIYLVQLPEDRGTNKYKIGRTWNPEQRFQHYNKRNSSGQLNVIKCVHVTDMFKAEKMLLRSLKEFYKPFKGEEWFDVPLEDIEYYFDEETSRFLIDDQLDVIHQSVIEQGLKYPPNTELVI